MKYYKDNNDNVYAYESNGSQDIYIKEDLIAITEKEANSILEKLNKPTKEQIIFNNKATVKLLIDESTLKIDILNDAINFGKAKDGDKDKLMAWRKYRVDLSQVDTNVENMELPEKPE